LLLPGNVREGLGADAGETRAMTFLDYFSPPPWAIPLYLFEIGTCAVVVFQMWLLWPLIKDQFLERLGKDEKVRAPPVGR
jgi:hypothetical protein